MASNYGYGLNKQLYIIAFTSNTGHKTIATKLFSIINPFNQLKHSLELKLLNFKNFVYC